MSLIWATRGRTWGFRFLRDGGFEDPLPVYDSAFAGIESGPSAIHRVGGTVAAVPYTHLTLATIYSV